VVEAEYLDDGLEDVYEVIASFDVCEFVGDYCFDLVGCEVGECACWQEDYRFEMADDGWDLTTVWESFETALPHLIWENFTPPDTSTYLSDSALREAGDFGIRSLEDNSRDKFGLKEEFIKFGFFEGAKSDLAVDDNMADCIYVPFAASEYMKEYGLDRSLSYGRYQNRHRARVKRYIPRKYNMQVDTLPDGTTRLFFVNTTFV